MECGLSSTRAGLSTGSTGRDHPTDLSTTMILFIIASVNLFYDTPRHDSSFSNLFLRVLTEQKMLAQPVVIGYNFSRL
jgi:hypothetical protein